MNKLKFLGFILTVSLLAIFVLTTCDGPLGMGLPIDWEAPVLTLDKLDNPLYVRAGTIISGKATDNVGVERIVFLDSKGNELFPVHRNGDNFWIELNFSSEYNGEKIVAEIRAYDKMGNSGGNSTAFITMIIDIKPPILEKLEIKRTDTKTAQMQKYSDLIALEGSDRQADLYKYQNGWFYMNAILKDDETKVKITKLEFYDSRYINILMFSLDIDSEEGYTPYYPRWTVREEDIINAGQTKFGGNYYSDYYNNRARYYYRVVVRALDMSNNENNAFSEDEGFICLWADSDKPKGVVDPGIIGVLEEDEAAIVSKNTSLPVNFYDDDSLLWAYTGLLKKAQWDLVSGADKEAKLLSLKQRLTGAAGDSVPETVPDTTDVFDWNNKMITDQIGGKSIDEKLVYLVTSNSDTDYGDYVLFTIAADKKLSPHPAAPAAEDVWTIKNNWAGAVVYINLKDENAPLIVFDTTATPPCPEENTFPQDLESGKYFYIVGYTLRENGNGSTFNQVKQFRMAWIPYGIPGGQDSKITAVQKALSDENYNSADALFKTDPSLADIQHWDFETSPTASTPPAGKGLLKLETFGFAIGGTTSKYTKQTFSKKFNVMGDDEDDINTSTQNFMYKGKLENETKLFIFYALDSMGNKVFRQLPILGFKNNPVMSIYDITYDLESLPTTPSVSTNIPNPTVTGNFIISSGAPSEDYYELLNTYNKYDGVIAALNNAYNQAAIKKEADPFQIYPRGTSVKYWVKTDKNRIPIATLTMQDITYASKPSERVKVGGVFKNDTFSFCEYYPDVTQRTFLFEATDKLGNVASVQRTVAVSNAARLESITTTEQSGTYGHGKVIVLQANFSSQIYVANDDGTMLSDQTKKPKINYRYKIKNQSGYVYDSVTCNTPAGGNNTNGFGLYSDRPTISLSFNFTVPENAEGDLETFDGDGSWDLLRDRPITLGDGTKIMDQARKDSAFIPGYSTGTITMPNWTTSNNNSLQSKKKITLDGVHPIISTKGLDTYNPTTNPNGTKDPYSGTGASAERYFKTGESIIIVLTSDKDIRASGNSRLQYSIQPATGPAQTFTTSFKYQKPVAGNSKQLVYSLKVDASSCPIDGELINVSLLQTADSDIIDNFNNNIVTSTATNLLNGLGRFYIKQKAPSAPVTTGTNAVTLNGTAFASAPTYFTGTVTLSVPASAAAAFAAWEDRKQYSTNGGLIWSAMSTASPLTGTISTAGAHNLQVRYIDRAGNEGDIADKKIEINNTFPALVSVNAVQPNGWYITGKTLTFNLNFADTVTVRNTNQANLSITLKNRGTSGTDNEITLTTNMSINSSGTTITFNWANISGKEMQDGVYISNVVLSGLSDKFGITGPTGSATISGNTPSNISVNSCPNLAAGIKVDAIAPSVTVRDPAHNGTTTGNASIAQLTLTFREPVIKGSGTITIRPRGSYSIPPVFEDVGYYLGTDGNRYTTAGTNRTYISSFYDVYNNSALSAADRNNLTQGATTAYGATQTADTTNPSASRLMMNTRTGQSAGPYKKTTQGLTEGRGYTGNYTSGATVPTPLSGANSPDTTAGYMVPDTATKWVLDYQYTIAATTGAVANIRNVLNKAKFRWQEIDVANLNIPATGSPTVTITLNEPLLKGLDYEVYYPEGTFTDLAGNSVPKSGNFNNDGTTSGTNNDYYFTTPGVQTPVIRVNRRSYDARTSDWALTTGGGNTYAAPANTATWNATTAVNDTNGWGIGNFETVHFRVESESQNLTAMNVQTTKGVTNHANTDTDITYRRAAKGAWTGTVIAANSNASSINTMNWTDGPSNTPGFWVTNNIVRRSYNGTQQTYRVITRNGIEESRTSTSANGNLSMFRSYNRDLKKSELDGITLTTQSNGYQGVITFDALEANKSYIVAQAVKNGESAKGYEGIYRTVIMLNFSGNKGSNFLLIEGSNIKNGMPSIAGFPVRDAEETGDRRFIKVFHHNDGTNNQNQNPRTQFYWVSTEIVCEWYFLCWGGGNSHQSVGEVNNYLTVGYGDLTYAYNIGQY
jgi:hypothetical protein